MPGGADTALFHFVLIKPTHYDDDGYPIQWVRSAIPSNTLACLNGLADEARRRHVLGPLDALDLYHATSGGEAALARQRRHDAIRARTQAAKAAAAVPSSLAG